MYKVPFVNYPEHYRRIWDEVTGAINECLSKGDLIMRAQMKQFEQDIADFAGVKYGIGLNSGTDTLQLSLLAAGIGTGDEVITVAHTFVASVAVIHHCGATPVLIDVRGDDYNMDIDLLEAAITPQTRAIMPVHLNGRCCDMEKLMAIADEHDLIVIEDSAQALGARFDGKMAGAWGLTGSYSFYPAKILGGAGDGGIVATDDEHIAEVIRLLRDHGQDRATGEILYYGVNSRLDTIQAAILGVKLKYLPGWIERRRELAALYEQGLSGIEQVKTPPQPDGRYFDVFTNYVIRAEERDRLVAHLGKSGIEVLISWPKPMHQHQALGLDHFHLPETEAISREVVSLPLFPELADEQVEYVIETIAKFYRQ